MPDFSDLAPAGFRAELEELAHVQVASAVQDDTLGYPPRPAALVVHWYGWDEPPTDPEHPYDQWHEIGSA